LGLPGSSIHLTDRALLDAFKEHLPVTEMSLFRRLRYGFLRFSSMINAMAAIQMRGTLKISGKRVHVSSVSGLCGHFVSSNFQVDFASNSFFQLANDINDASPMVYYGFPGM
jgi:RNA recognition motif-containing protein